VSFSSPGFGLRCQLISRYQDVTIELQRRVLIEVGLFDHDFDEIWDDVDKCNKPMPPEVRS
jgi:hypothetical protein